MLKLNAHVFEGPEILARVCVWLYYSIRGKAVLGVLHSPGLAWHETRRPPLK